MAIDLQGKNACAALFARLEAAGCPVAVFDGELVCADEAKAQAIIDAYSLADVKAARCAEVSAYSGMVRDRFMAGKSAAEMSSWPLKVKQAEAYATSGSAADAPMLALEAQARGVTLAQLVAKVQANTVLFSQLEAVIAGIDGKHRDAIMAITAESAGSEAAAFAAVASYDFTVGWPAP
jgi:hypothetical protein